MTLWAKVLTVVVLVLSLIFAGMSAMVYAKRQAYRQMYEQEQKAHAADKKADGEKITTLEQRATDLTNSLTEKTAQLNEKDLTIASLKREGDNLKSTLNNTQLTLDNEQAQVTKLSATNSDLTKDNQRLVAENDKVKSENRDWIAKLSAEQDLTRKLQASVDELQKTRDSLQAQLKLAKETLALNEETFSELAKRNIEARTVIASLQAVPPIDGRVLVASQDTRTVVLNVGAKQGVRKNIDFTIFRGSDFIAKVNVFSVEDNRCAATIVTSTGPVKTNDVAQTRLHF